jgi:hypothetical protein
MLDDDLELSALRALNARLEALYARLGEGGDCPKPVLEIAIDALEREVVLLIQARCDARLSSGRRPSGVSQTGGLNEQNSVSLPDTELSRCAGSGH